jgi:hypothetical protein
MHPMQWGLRVSTEWAWSFGESCCWRCAGSSFAGNKLKYLTEHRMKYWISFLNVVHGVCLWLVRNERRGHAKEESARRPTLVLGLCDHERQTRAWSKHAGSFVYGNTRELIGHVVVVERNPASMWQ